MTFSPSIGVLLVNLGTPRSPSAPSVREFLGEFLSDKRVVDLPSFLWQILLRGAILPFRSHYTARLYQRIWMKEGSPLMVYSQRLTEKVQALLGQQYKVVLAMRYGEPSIQSALKELDSLGTDSLVVMGLYPQQSSATSGSCFDGVVSALQRSRFLPHFSFISSYFDHPYYIQLWVAKIREYWSKKGRSAYLLFSFHGIPKQWSQRGDPYERQCYTTARLITEQLGLSKEAYHIVFQSRFGKGAWLKPYCEETLKQLLQKGVKKVVILCPGFAVDCLETLEEVALRYRRLFLESGGESFDWIPSLNDSRKHSQLLVHLIQQAAMKQFKCAEHIL